ncbi:complex I subunit 4 family protein [Dermatobacter hominis]|uniref:complex I subunit 4 family protein n=1 Tax=Dermatobacter hominis TaxID=2884263 RepID=UPI001D115A26|nr:NADH-quinone oxidoreductase subunit M [Dermatobacter hominis]UDY33970.1 NADH-quinone oxidoreductase subunit M [Dermatobacter hominis]
MGALLASEAAASSSFPLLAVMIILPFAGAALIGLVPRNREEFFRPIALLTSAATGALAIYLLTQFDRDDAGFQFTIDHSWITDLGVRLHFGVDGISLFLIVLTGVIFPIAILGAKPHGDEKAYYAWMLILMAGSMGVFSALDLLVFFIFFEVVLVPMYFLIGLWGYGERVYAATKFFLYTMFGSAFMLVGMIALAVLHQRETGGPITFDLVTLATDQAVSTTAARWIFVAFAIAFAVKVPLVPLHTWLPDAHTQAPTAGSVILAAVMLKLGTYGYLRFGLYLLPEAAAWAAPVMLTLGVIGITYGAIAATMQKDLKRLVAYSSVAHLGFIVLGTFSLTTQGITGGLLVMVNHGITTGALFLLVGMIYERRHTRLISELSGMQKAAPVLAGVFTVVMLASVGLPGLNGFPGELLSLLGAFKGARWWGVVAVTGVILAALYLLWAYQRTFHGKATGANATMRDMKMSEFLVMAPLLALIVFLGLFPGPMIETMEPSVKALVAHVSEHSDTDRADQEDVEKPVVKAEAAEAEQGEEHG